MQLPVSVRACHDQQGDSAQLVHSQLLMRVVILTPAYDEPAYHTPWPETQSFPIEVRSRTITEARFPIVIA